MAKTRKNKASAPTKSLSIKQQWEAKKPERPHRPSSKYANFVAFFSKANAESKGKDLFKEISCAWGKLDQNERTQYENPDEMEEYREQMEEYRRVIKAMKRPPVSFAIFVQHYWKVNKPEYDSTDKKQFGLIHKKIAKEWAKASEEVKSSYKATAEALKVKFKQEQEAVLAGERDINVNWREEAIAEVSRILKLKPKKGKGGGGGDLPHSERTAQPAKTAQPPPTAQSAGPTTRQMARRAAPLPSKEEETDDDMDGQNKGNEGK